MRTTAPASNRVRGPFYDQGSLQPRRAAATVGYMGSPARTNPHPIALRRLQAGLTQQQLADATGVHRTTITRIEQRTTEPTLASLQRIAEVLQVQVDDLIEGPPRELGVWHGMAVQVLGSGSIKVGAVVLTPLSHNFRADLARWLRRRGVVFLDEEGAT